MKPFIFRLLGLILAFSSGLALSQPTVIGPSINYSRGSSASIPRVMKVDAQGNIYIVGKYDGGLAPLFNPYSNATPQTDSDSPYDVYVAKYDAGGVLLWISSGMTENAAFMDITDLELDANGNAYITGYVRGANARFYDATTNYSVSGHVFNSQNYDGAYAIKYSSAGAISWIWTKNVGATGANYNAYAVAVSGSNVYVSGSYGPAYVATLNATTGAETAMNTIGSGNIDVRDMVRDASGNFYLTGAIKSNVNLGGSTISAHFNGNVFVAKYNGSFAHQWSHQVTTMATTERGVKLQVNSSGEVFLMGHSNLSGNTETLFRKYNSAGTLQAGSFSLTSEYFVRGTDMVLDNNGNLFVVGDFNGTCDLNPGAGFVGINVTTRGYFRVNYTSALAYNWSLSSSELNNSLQTQIITAFDGFNKYHQAWGYDYSGNRNGYLSTHSFNSDVTRPTVSAFYPTDNATGIAESANLTMTFSENVQASTGGTVTIRKSSDLSVVESYTLPSANVTVSGNAVTINPTNNLAAGGYYVIVSGGAFRDATGNFFMPITSSATWNFTTATSDVTPPSVTALSPLDNATGIDIAANLVATFNENISGVASKVVSVKRMSDNVVFESYTLPSANVTVSGNTVTINPSANLVNSTSYYLNIDAGSFIDAAGNPYAGITNNSTWNFTTSAAADGIPPTALTFSPVDNATGVDPASNLVASFSENVVAVSSKIVSIKRTSDNATFESYTLPHANVTVSGNVVTINPTGTLANNTGYYVNMDVGAFRDAASNDFAGIANNTTWNFTTVAAGDVTPPSVISVFPADGTTSMAATGVFEITFNEPVFIADGTSFRFRRTSNNAADIFYTTPAIQVTVSGSTITITPSTSFTLDNTEYWVEITSGIRDASNNFFAGISSNTFWNFTTGDITRPTFNSLSPNDGAATVAVAQSPVIYFTESIFAVSGKVINIKKSSDNSVFASYTLPSSNVVINNTVVGLSKPSNFDYSTDYYIEIEEGAFVDAAGNDFAGITNSTTWNFTTISTAAAPPTITALSPTNGATNVLTNANLIATFSENITAVNTKFIQIVLASNSSVVHTYTLPHAAVNVSGNTLTINPETDLAGNTAYWIYMQGGVVKDANNNDFAGMTVNNMWAFTTATPVDATPPTIASLNPVNTGMGLAVDANLQAIFSENISAVNGKVVAIRRMSDNSVFESYTLPSGNVGIGANAITINPTGNFLNSTGYYVTMDVGAFQDADGNPFAGIANNTIWSFTTAAAADASPPVIVSSTPASGATGISTSLSSIVIQFNENIFSGNSNNLILQGNGYNQYFDFNQPTQALFSGSTLTLYPNAQLPAATVMTVYLYDQSIRDANNNYIPGYQFSFTTQSTFSATTFSPVHNATNVSPSANLTITFNDNVGIGAGTISVHRVSDNSQVASLSNFNGSYMTTNGTSATFNFPSDLPASTELYVNVSNGYLRSSANTANTWSGIQNATSWRFTTSKLDQTITFGALEAKTFGNANFDLMATASSGLAVSYASSNTAVATVSGNTVTIIGAGSTTITASQAGNGTYNAATNVQQTLTVNKANQTITFNTLAAKTFGDANFTLSATASSGLGVSYASSNTAVATVSGNTVTIVGAGSTTITASQAGNGNYNVATNVQQTLTVNKANQTITFSDIPAKTVGDPAFALSATASSGLTVSFVSSNTAVATVSGSTVTIVSAGSAVITASQSGNGNFNAASTVDKTLVVSNPAKQNQTITFNALATKTFGDANFNLTATASSGLTVSYISSNSSVATINGNTVTIVGAGSTTITANQAGNDSFNPASGVQQILTVNKANQTITFSTLAARTFGDAVFDLTGSASSGLLVSYSSSNTSVATVSGSTITIVGAGSTTITATQGGNANYNAASSVGRTLTVNKADQTITFGSIAAKSVSDPPFSLTATATSGLAISYSSSNAAVATVSGSTVTIVGQGNTIITASQSGNANYNAASSVQQTLTVLSQTRVISLSGNMSFGELIVPESVTRVLTISNTGNVVLTISNITYPPGFSGDKTSGTVTAGGTLTVNVTLTAAEAITYSGNIVVTSDATSGSSSIAVSGTGVTITGLEPELSSNLKVYPNPGTGIFSIEVNEPSNELVSICDQTGRVALQVDLDKQEEGRYSFNIREQAAGLYFVKVQTKSGVKVARVIKVDQ